MVSCATGKAAIRMTRAPSKRHKDRQTDIHTGRDNWMSRAEGAAPCLTSTPSSSTEPELTSYSRMIRRRVVDLPLPARMQPKIG